MYAIYRNNIVLRPTRTGTQTNYPPEAVIVI